jgi:DNA topoisomerase-1
LYRYKTGNSLEQQLAVTTYLVDKLALRAGGEKDEDLADTVGVCTLRVGHLDFLPPSTIKFDFLGKDSIRYLQEHEVDPLVFNALQKFCKGKKPDHDIFDQIDPSKVNKHLQSLMPGLTIKVFRTYNASYTLNKLLKETDKTATLAMKKSKYDSANKEVAVLCNHQKGVSKAHDAQMEKLVDKQKAMEKELVALKKEKTDKTKAKIATMKERLGKLELQMKMKDELKTVSLGTSKINYLDPRITIAWCKEHEVPPPTVYTRALVEKFNWAMDCEPSFDF